MEASTWERLPWHIVELVLSHIPIRVLFKFRRVCKTWNEAIMSPSFASLCALVPTSPCILITSRMSLYLRRGPVFSVLFDTADSSVHTVVSASKKNYMASDSGLVYTIALDRSRQPLVKHFVLNPLSKTFHRIPAPFYDFSYCCALISMRVDRSSQDYFIAVMDSQHSTTTPPHRILHHYDSRTKVWVDIVLPEEHYVPFTSVYFQGKLHVIFLDRLSIPWRAKLFSLWPDLSWRAECIELPHILHGQDKFVLVETRGRLFLVEYTGLPMFLYMSMAMAVAYEPVIWSARMTYRHNIRLRISEITRGHLVFIVERSIGVYTAELLRMHRSAGLREFISFVGCGDIIQVISSISKCTGWHLSREKWIDLPLMTKRNLKHEPNYMVKRGGTWRWLPLISCVEDIGGKLRSAFVFLRKGLDCRQRALLRAVVLRGHAQDAIESELLRLSRQHEHSPIIVVEFMGRPLSETMYQEMRSIPLSLGASLPQKWNSFHTVMNMEPGTMQNF